MKFWILGGVYLQCRKQGYTNVLFTNFILFFFYFFHEACRKEIITWHCHAWVMCQLITILATYILMSLLAEAFFMGVIPWLVCVLLLCISVVPADKFDTFWQSTIWLHLYSWGLLSYPIISYFFPFFLVSIDPNLFIFCPFTIFGLKYTFIQRNFRERITILIYYYVYIFVF